MVGNMEKQRRDKRTWHSDFCHKTRIYGFYTDIYGPVTEILGGCSNWLSLSLVPKSGPVSSGQRGIFAVEYLGSSDGNGMDEAEQTGQLLELQGCYRKH